MSRQSTTDKINQAMFTLMRFTRKSRSPISGFRQRDFHILNFIELSNDRHAVTMSELAKQLNVTVAAASQIVSTYENKGWVQRVRGSQDRRTVYIELTKTAREQLEAKWAHSQKKLEGFLEALGEEDCENLERILDKIVKRVEADLDE